MAAFVKFQPFVDYLCDGDMNLSSDTLQVALTTHGNTPAVGNGLLGDLTEIAYTNLSTQEIVTISSTQTAGVYSLVLTDLVLTASGDVPTFRHVVVFDQTATSDPLIAWFDYGSDVTLANGETFTIDFGASLFTLE